MYYYVQPMACPLLLTPCTEKNISQMKRLPKVLLRELFDYPGRSSKCHMGGDFFIYQKETGQ